MIQIEIGNVKSCLIGELDPKVISALYNKLAAEVQGSFYARKQNPYWDGLKHFFSKSTLSFPTGMIHLVREVLEKKGIEYQYNDLRIKPKAQLPLPLHNVILRPYQQNTVDEAIKKERGIARIATGGGKSTILSAIVGKQNLTSLVLIHRIEILQQLKETLERILQVPIGQVGGGVIDIKKITVALCQSAHELKEFLPTVEALHFDECFPSFQRILTDRGSISIANLYRAWKAGEILPKVLSYNESLKIFEYQPITYAWEKRAEDDLVRIKHGRSRLVCTKNHLLLTTKGYKRADTVKVGDFLIGNVDSTSRSRVNVPMLNSDQEQIILGSFLGDGNLQKSKNGRFRLRLNHGFAQKDYCEWKGSIIGGHIKIKEHNGFSQKPAVIFQSFCFDLDKDLPQKKTHCPQWVLNRLDLRGLAIWLMDDGSRSTTTTNLWTSSFDEESQQRILKRLQAFGFKCRLAYYKRKDKTYTYITFPKESTVKLSQLLSSYIHPSMQYKILNPTNCFSYMWDKLIVGYGTSKVDKVSKYGLENLMDRRQLNLYDLQIENNHNYVVVGQEHLNNPNATTQGIIAHNCHHCPSESYWQVAQDCKNAYYRYGYTATNWREDNMDIMLDGFAAKKFVDINASKLIEEGWLVPPTIYLYDFQHERKNRKGVRYPTIYNEEVTNNLKRNQLVVDLAMKAVEAGKSTLILINYIEHGENLLTLLKAVYPDIEFIHGSTEAGKRQKVLLEFKEGTRKLLLASNILGEGVDIPKLEVLITARAEASTIAAYQALGRTLRPSESKTKAIIVDVFDSNCKYLESHASARLKIYASEPRYKIVPVSDLNGVNFNG